MLIFFLEKNQIEKLEIFSRCWKLAIFCQTYLVFDIFSKTKFSNFITKHFFRTPVLKWVLKLIIASNFTSLYVKKNTKKIEKMKVPERDIICPNKVTVCDIDGLWFKLILRPSVAISSILCTNCLDNYRCLL